MQNLFNNNQGQTQNIFSNPNTAGNNLFNQGSNMGGGSMGGMGMGSNMGNNMGSNMGGTPNLFQNNLQSQQGTNIFSNQSTGYNTPNQMTTSPSPNIFNNQPMQQTNFFNPLAPQQQQQPANIFGNPQPTNNMFSNPQQYPSQMTFNLSPVQPVQQISQEVQDQEILKKFQKRGLVRLIQNIHFDLSDANTFKNCSIKKLSELNQEIVKGIKTALEKVRTVQKEADAIALRNRELFTLLASYNEIARKRLQLYKKAFLESIKKSNMLASIEENLNEFQKIAEMDFQRFYQNGVNQRYGLSVSNPSEFELKLSGYVLTQATILLDKLSEYQESQNANISDINYVDVVPPLIDYYKNVACSIRELKEKYAKVTEEIKKRSRMASFAEFQSALESKKKMSLKKSSETYDRVLKIEEILKIKILHCIEMKNKYKLEQGMK